VNIFVQAMRGDGRAAQRAEAIVLTSLAKARSAIGAWSSCVRTQSPSTATTKCVYANQATLDMAGSERAADFIANLSSTSSTGIAADRRSTIAPGRWKRG